MQSTQFHVNNACEIMWEKSWQSGRSLDIEIHFLVDSRDVTLAFLDSEEDL